MPKEKLPWFKFFPGDWMKDPDLRRCSPAARGVWMDMLCLMWECDERGVLRSNSQPWSDEDVAAAIVGPHHVVLDCIRELCDKGVVSRSKPDGSLGCRRMIREFGVSKERATAGRTGGLVTQAKRKQIAKQKGSKSLIYDFCLLISEILTEEFKESADFKQAWLDWVQHRKRIKHPLTERAARWQLKKFKEMGHDGTIEAISEGIGRDWRAIKPEWLTGQNAAQDSRQRDQSSGSTHRAERRQGEFAEPEKNVPDL